ncbi:CD4-1 molecule isoform X2 [Tachysurus fulvidraco]|uniref:CD4-1 molecule isoform X2 n=2 Tax=Tachysurus fulvidraco TaxID=1234273 RepID=UPI001FF0730D|nr:CD4-1 molecule isoform X2 [Tachysurus fulvidraco]
MTDYSNPACRDPSFVEQRRKKGCVVFRLNLIDLRDKMSFLLVLLLLLAPFHSSAAPSPVLAQVGNAVTLPLEPWGIPDNIHVNWNFNGGTLFSRNPTASSNTQVPTNWQGRVSLTENFSLHISPVTENDFGTFTCDQHKLVDSKMTTFKLYEVKMPTLPPKLVNDSLTLSCEINHEGFNLVRPTVRWIGPDNKIYHGQTSKNKYTLNLLGVSSNHNGNWICEVNYGAGRKLNAMSNVVIVDLAPSPLDPIYTSDSYSNFPIPCFFSSKISWATVNATGVMGGSWSFTSLNGSAPFVLLKLHLNPYPVWKIPPNTQGWLMESGVKNNDLGVTISRVSINHRGSYTCSLDFSLRTSRRRVQVEVLQVISSAGKNMYEGSTLNLTCTLGHPMPPDLEVNWKSPYGSSLSILSLPHLTELSIPGVRLKDSGRWACELKKNKTVLATATITLKIEKAPVNIWLVVGIIAGILVLILVLAIVIFSIRRRRKVVMHTRRKRRFCCCKNPQPKGFYKT